ncbi:MAG: DUF3187 family protein [Geobacteraceae bacterium]|nr:DUF3187 family protein [Geobacteraceae bacterium]
MVSDKPLLTIVSFVMLVTLSLLGPAAALALEITPFNTFNQSPLVQIFGLPAAESAHVLERGKVSGQLTVDMASNFAHSDDPREQIALDGEIYRTTLATRYGVGRGVEIGLDLPYLAESGGFQDGAIIGFHDFFDISQAGRDEVPRNRLLFRYVRDGVERVNIDHANGGFGDIRLSSALQLLRGDDRPGRAVALRASLKVPTGDSALLHGSGSTDFALWLSAAEDYRFAKGHCTVFGAAGGMAMTSGDVLREMQRNLAAFATLGVGWSSWQRVALKAQLNGNTPFYRNSSLRELSSSSVQVVAGGTVGLSENTFVDIAFTEDILVIAASPDFVINLALRTRF